MITPVSQPTNENYFTTRVDYRINDNQTIFSRFTLDQGDRSNPDDIPVTSANPLTQARYATVQHQWIVTAQFLVTTRVTYNRTVLASDVLPNVAFPPTTFLFNKKYPASVQFAGANRLAASNQDTFRNVHNRYQFNEDHVYTRGSYSMKWGFDFQKLGMNIDGGGRDFGEFNWGTIQDFLEDRRPLTFVGAAPGSSAVRTLRQDFLGLYFQDDWKLRSTLTVNWGLRYEPYSVPTEKWGRLSQVRDWKTATELGNDFGFFRNPSKLHFSPRIGFAWSPGGTGATAVRGGFGLFYIPHDIMPWKTQTYRNAPYYGTIDSLPPSLGGAVAYVNKVGPAVLSSTLSSDSFMQVPDYNVNSTYEMKLNLTVERDIGYDTSVAVGYLGSRAIHLTRYIACNTRPPTLVDGREFVSASTPRPNPNLGNCILNYTDGQGF